MSRITRRPTESDFLRRPIETALRSLRSRADITLCPTDLTRLQLAIRRHPRLQIWGRGVNTELFKPDRFDTRMRWRLSGGDPQKPLILYVGRLAKEKRLLDLLAAARLLPDALFALVGDGPQRDELERGFACVPAVFTGFLRGETLAQAFASADVFAFPSESETFGQVVLQAMAFGVPLVVIAGPASAEFVADRVVVFTCSRVRQALWRRR